MKLTTCGIVGLALVELDTHEDERGSFREAYHDTKLRDLGLSIPKPVQMNVAESIYGVIRGVHAEPWDKYIHVVSGQVFAAIADFRANGDTFGRVESFELNRGNALFVPEGLGNSYAVTTDRAIYTYLVPKHWSPDLTYPAVAFDDPDLAIDWPIPKDKQLVSDKDRANPSLKEAFPNAV